MQFQQIAGWSGIGFAASVVSANLVTAVTGLPPGLDAGPEEVAAFFAEHADAARISSGIAPIAWTFLAVFAAGAFTRLWRAEQERERGAAWSLVGLIGAVMQISMFSTVVSSEIALVDGGGQGIWSLHNAMFGVNAISLGVVLGGFSMAGLKTGVLRRWHASLGLTGSALCILAAIVAPWSATGTAALTVIGFLGFGLWIIWISTAGLQFARSRPIVVPA